MTHPVALSELLKRTYRGRRVLVTGHNGFVGSWLSFWLATSGADVVGVSLAPERGGLADALELSSSITAIEADVRDPAAMKAALRRYQPEIVFHLAAQALVLPSFVDPIGTFATNVMGTADLLDAVRHEPTVKACVVITSDKCYATGSGAQIEGDPLGGEDPYSASKAAAEIVTHAFRSSYFSEQLGGLATARAGNIMGGGDWAPFRIVPDCIRAIRAGEPVRLRNPDAVRPWQHVLDALAGYLRLGDALVREPELHSQAWNFGPSTKFTATVGEIVEAILEQWRVLGGGPLPEPVAETALEVPERYSLTLVSEKAEEQLHWMPQLDLHDSIAWTIEWYHRVENEPHGTARQVTESQIQRFLALDESSFGEPLHKELAA